jgi:hypothetical protein
VGDVLLVGVHELDSALAHPFRANSFSSAVSFALAEYSFFSECFMCG